MTIIEKIINWNLNNNKQLNLFKKLNDLFVIKSKLDSDIFW